MTTCIGKYELVRRLGGGMAEVFLAKTIGVEGFARPVAIERERLHHSADLKIAAMFCKYARLSRLGAPGASTRALRRVALVSAERPPAREPRIVGACDRTQPADGSVEKRGMSNAFVVHHRGGVA